jgi:hypothetical protein
MAQMKPSAFIAQFVDDGHYAEVERYMHQLRNTGLTPSDTLKRGLDYAELFTLDSFPSATRFTQLNIAATLWEVAASSLEIHSGEKKQQKLVEAAKK